MATIPHVILAVDDGRKDPFHWVYDDPMGLCTKDLQLDIVHAVKDDKDKPKGLELLKRFEAEANKLFKDRFIVHTKLLSSKEGTGHALVEYANEIKPKLLVMGSSGSGLFKLHILGSVSDYVQHHCQCPLVLVKTTHRGDGKQRTAPLQVAVAVDHNVHSDHAVEWILTETNMPKKSTLVLLHVVKKAQEKPEARKFLASYKPKCVESKKDFTMKSGLVYFKGKKPADSILKYCHDYGVGMLVVASRMQSALARQLKGSITDQCVRHAECDVMVWKDERTRRLSMEGDKTSTEAAAAATAAARKDSLDASLDDYDVAMMEMAYAQAGYDRLEPLSPSDDL